MKNRERIKKVFNHEEPDKVLLDIGVARGCGITIPAYKNLLTYPGLSYENIKSSQLTTQLTEVDKEVFNMLGIVFLSIRLNSICKTLIKKRKRSPLVYKRMATALDKAKRYGILL